MYNYIYIHAPFLKYLNNTNGSPVHGNIVDVLEIANSGHLTLIYVHGIAIFKSTLQIAGGLLCDGCT